MSVTNAEVRFVPGHGALVVSGGEAQHLTRYIFERKLLSDGRVVVPDQPSVVTALRRLGFDVPGPILRNYDWRNTKPFEVQKLTASLMTLERRAFVLNGMGTGKTRSVLYAFDYLRKVGEAGRMLVIAPLSILSSVWTREILEFAPEWKVAVVHGTKAQRQKILSAPHDVSVINFDGVAIVAEQLLKQRYDVVCIDELSAYRNHRSARWRAAYPFVQAARYAWGLTGTPTPRAPTDAFGLLKLMKPDDPRARSFFAFETATMRQVSRFVKVPRPNAADYVSECLKPSVRFSLSDVAELPETVWVDRQVPCSKQQEKLYQELIAQMVTLDKQVVAATEGVLLNKLLQVSAGCVYDTDKRAHLLDAGPRVDALLEALEETSHNVLVFVPFRALLPSLALKIKKTLECDVSVVHGGVPMAQRVEVFSAFKQSPAHGRRHVLVAQPATMAHGLTLTEADTIIWYGPVHDLETYEQANARIVRPGQVRKTLILHIVSTRAEDRVYRNLKQKKNMQGVLLNLLASNGAT